MLIKKIKYILILCIIFSSILYACSKIEFNFKSIPPIKYIDSNIISLVENTLLFEANKYLIYDENNYPFYVKDLNVSKNITYQNINDYFPGDEIIYENQYFKIIFYQPNNTSVEIIDIQPKNTLTNDWRYSFSKDLNLNYYEVIKNVQCHVLKNYNTDYSHYILFEINNYNIDFSNNNIYIPDNLTQIKSDHYYLEYSNNQYIFISSELGYRIIDSFYQKIPLKTVLQTYEDEVLINIENLKSSISYISLLPDKDWKTIKIMYYNKHGLIKFENNSAKIYCYYTPMYSHIIYAEYYDEDIVQIANKLNISTWELDQNAYLTETNDIKYFDNNNNIYIYKRTTK